MSFSNETEVLLKEYEICSTDADRFEKYIWTTAGLLISASVAGISLLGASLPTPAKPRDYLIRILVSILSIGFVWVWRIAALRWYAIQKIMYYRAKEIEITLGMYKERYLFSLDRAVLGEKYDHDEKIDLTVSTLGIKHKAGGARSSVNRISALLIIVWLLTTVIQLLGMLGVL